jgi:hypothetical protein
MMTPTDKLLFVPEALFSIWRPTSMVSWAAKHTLHFIVTMTWLFTVVWWAMPILLSAQHAIGAYRTFKRNQRTQQDW